MSGFTKGPLIVGTMAMSKKDFASLYSNSLVTVQSGADVLAIVWSPDDDERDDEQGAKANAQIYAAAPFMLFALENVEWSLTISGEKACPQCKKPMSGWKHSPVCSLGNAIKKARGEA